MASFFADLLLPRQWELTWSSDRSPAWVQPATLLLAIVSLWSLAEAVLASQLRTMALGPTAEQGRFTTRRLLESVARRGGFMTLWLTVLGAIACAESTDASVKPTSVLSDMATVGVLLGLALCVPLSLSTMWNCFGEMRRAGQITKLAQGVIAAGVVGAAMSLACLGAVGQLVRALGGSA